MHDKYNEYIELIISNPAFDGIKTKYKELIKESINFRKVSIGAKLTIDNEISSDIVFAVNGSIRPTTLVNQKVISHRKQGPGAIVGLASILSMRHCEDCIATEDMIIGVINENTILEIYANDKYFQEWCDNNLWPQEVMQLVSDITKKQSKSIDITPSMLNEIIGSSVLVRPNHKSIAKALDLGFQLYVSTGEANIVDRQVTNVDTIYNETNKMSTRIIGIKSESLYLDENFYCADPENSSIPNNETENNIQISSSFLPTRSKLENKGSVLSNLKLIRGEGELQETLACIQMISICLNLPFRKDTLAKILQETKTSKGKIDLRVIAEILSRMDLLVSGIRVNSEYLFRSNVPSLLRTHEGFVVLASSNHSGVVVASPKRGILKYSREEIESTLGNDIEMLTVDKKYSTPSKKFGLSWFLPLLKKYKQFLAQTLLSSFVIQFLILCNPLIVQVIIDKVVNQRSLDSLQILGIALLAITIIEGLLSIFKTFLFTDTTNKIDQRLGTEVIDHLLRLPLSYFDKRPVGDLSTRFGELQKIRNFLVGQGLSTVLDAIFCVIYIFIMTLYSLKLTFVALAVIPIQIVLTLIGSPIFRNLLLSTTKANAKTQSFLVEILTGIRTVKSQNIEVKSRSNWQTLYSDYINKSFGKTIAGTLIVQFSQTLQKISQLLVLWVGASFVLDGTLSLGQLIAFRIISGYVTQPLLRISSIWQNIQELNISLYRISDIIDHKQESSPEDTDMIQMPLIDGKIKLKDLSFCFPDSSSPAVNSVSIDINPGAFVAIVGSSGSGKSTLTQLISRLYEPTSGRILIDEYDISKVELYSLRRQLGVVSQDPLLFAGSIRENIAIASPDATESEIVRAAKLACAHDFIQDLPSGYSTLIGERGSSLSGGQRQRISIARTLLTHPKLLILDEATSALDYLTEKSICKNLTKHYSTITTIFVTHRLEAIRDADLIMVMDKGSLKEYGNHDHLINLGNTYYSLCQSR